MIILPFRKQTMELVETNSLTAAQKELLLIIWNKEYPVTLRYETVEDLDKYLAELKDIRHILLFDDDNILSGWTYSFVREGERWFAIILSGTVQGKGYGRLMLNALKEPELELNGWVIDKSTNIKADGTYYASPLLFYEKAGFEVLHDVRMDNGKMCAVKIKWTAG